MQVATMTCRVPVRPYHQDTKAQKPNAVLFCVLVSSWFTRQSSLFHLTIILAGLASVPLRLQGAEPKTDEPSEVRGRVCGMVVNSVTGEPIAGAYVAVDHSGDAGGSNLERFRQEGIYATTETDEKGRFVLDGVAFLDNHPFMVTYPEFVRHQETIAVRKNEPEIDMTVRLKPGATIVAKMVDADGRLLGQDAVFRLEARDGRAFLPMRDDWPDLPYRIEATKTGMFSFGELDTGVFTVEAIRSRRNQTVYHGRVSEIAIEAGGTKEVLLKPAGHRSTVRIKLQRDPHAFVGETKGAMALVVSRGPALLAWASGNFYHPEDERLGRVWRNAFMTAYLIPVSDADATRRLLTGKRFNRVSEEGFIVNVLTSPEIVHTLRNFPPGEYAAFTFAMGKYGGWESPGVYLRGTKVEISHGRETGVEIAWIEPIGPAPTNARVFHRQVTLEGRDYSAQEICELLAKETGAKEGEFIADSTSESGKVALPAGKVQIWDLLETIYLKKGWRLEADFKAGKVFLRGAR